MSKPKLLVMVVVFVTALTVALFGSTMLAKGGVGVPQSTGGGAGYKVPPPGPRGVFKVPPPGPNAAFPPGPGGVYHVAPPRTSDLPPGPGGVYRTPPSGTHGAYHMPPPLPAGVGQRKPPPTPLAPNIIGVL
jgi:hypothetical protein